ncbi:MAG: DUF6069 family protein, partial [Actinomycetota bacterium]|nr:DUF6069 family protein [Actinomycetota bacterium]
LGWTVVALLERRARRPRRVWMITGLIVLVLSLSGPLSGHGVTAGERLALICMHLAVAAVLVPVYAHNLAAVRRSRPPVASARAEADETRPG